MFEMLKSAYGEEFLSGISVLNGIKGSKKAQKVRMQK
jgi:hypothetical protein